jgi:hypothetical protein
MKSWFRNLFSENGAVSMVRVMALVVCLTACYIALTKGPDETGVISVLLTTAFGAKVVQKHIEVKSGDRQETR